MDALRKRENTISEEVALTDETTAGFSTDGEHRSGREREQRKVEPPSRPLTIREAIEVMKIMAPAVPYLKSEKTAPGFVRELMAYFKDHDPTATIRLLSLLYHEPIEILVDYLEVDSGMEVFQMISYGFTLNSIADLLEAAKILGFVKEEENG